MRTTVTCPKCSGKKMMVVDLRQLGAGDGRLNPQIPVITYDVRVQFSS